MCPLLTPIYEQMVELGSALWQKVTEFYRMIRRALEVFFLERTDIAVCFTIAEAIFSKPRVNLHNEGFTSTTVAPGTRAELWKKSGFLPVLFKHLENVSMSGGTEVTVAELEAIGWTVDRVIEEIANVYRRTQNSHLVNGGCVNGNNSLQTERFFRLCAERLAPSLFQAMANKVHSLWTIYLVVTRVLIWLSISEMSVKRGFVCNMRKCCVTKTQ